MLGSLRGDGQRVVADGGVITNGKNVRKDSLAFLLLVIAAVGEEAEFGVYEEGMGAEVAGQHPFLVFALLQSVRRGRVIVWEGGGWEGDRLCGKLTDEGVAHVPRAPDAHADTDVAFLLGAQRVAAFALITIA